jgi:hypothetical protein
MSKNLNTIPIVTQLHSDCAIFLRPGRPHNTLLIWELGWALEDKLTAVARSSDSHKWRGCSH